MTEMIFLDTDFLSSFLVANGGSLITQLYPGRVGIPKQVLFELKKAHFLKVQLNVFLQNESVTIFSIDEGSEASDLYWQLTTNPDEMIGKGEAAVIVLAKQYNGVICSNNFRDVRKYSNLYRLSHKSSGDILVEAMTEGLITEGQGNVYWKQMLRGNRKLPCESFSDYLSNH